MRGAKMYIDNSRFIIQEVAYDKDNASKTKVLWTSGVSYTLDQATKRTIQLLEETEKEMPKREKGKTIMFIAIINQNWELEKAYYLYEGKVEKIMVATIEELEQFIVDINEYNYNEDVSEYL